MTSWATPLIVGLAVIFLSTVFNPGEAAYAAMDVPWGFATLVLAFTVMPVGLMVVTGTIRLIGREVRLSVDRDGVEGWPDGPEIDRRWSNLRRPRIESRVIVLPFDPPPNARRGWVVIPRRAVTPRQLHYLVAQLHEHDFLRRGDGRSITGRVLGVVLDRWPHRTPTPQFPGEGMGGRETIAEGRASPSLAAARSPDKADHDGEPSTRSSSTDPLHSDGSSMHWEHPSARPPSSD